MKTSIQSVLIVARWRNILDPDILTAPWSIEEDKIIIEVTIVLHTYIHTYINTYIHTYIHLLLHTYLHTYYSHLMFRSIL